MGARRSTDYHMRVAPTELRAWRRAAKHDDVSLAQWVRRLCNTAAKDRVTLTSSEEKL